MNASSWNDSTNGWGKVRRREIIDETNNNNGSNDDDDNNNINNEQKNTPVFTRFLTEQEAEAEE